MQRLEYHTNILNDGQIPIPIEIQNQLLIKPDIRIKVIIEIPQNEQLPEDQYSFKKVRQLTSGIKGNMSSDIIADREDRI